jgi:cytohesin
MNDFFAFVAIIFSPDTGTFSVALEIVQSTHIFGLIDLLTMYNNFNLYVDVGPDANYSSLNLAAMNGDLDTVRTFIQNAKDTDIVAKDTNGRNVLHFAALYGHTDVVKFLIEELKVKKHNLLNTLLNAETNNEGSEVGRDNDFDFFQFKGMLALHLAAVNGHVAIVERLLQEKPDDMTKRVSSGDYAGMTVWHVSVAWNRLDLVQFLLQKTPGLLDESVQANNKDWRDMNALHLAVSARQYDVVKFLLMNGANIEAKIPDSNPYYGGITVLHLAVQMNDMNTVELLLDRGADIEAKCINDMNALHYAVQEGNMDIVELLLNRGANIEAKCANGMNVLHLAAKLEAADILEMLLQKCYDKRKSAEDIKNILRDSSFRGFSEWKARVYSNNHACYELLKDRIPGIWNE